MRFIICKDYDEMSLRGAELIKAVVTLKPNCVLGLATGSTPEGLYQYLVKFHQSGLDFSQVKSVNLDEYKGITKESDQSYAYFMKKHLFGHINIRPENTHLPDGSKEDGAQECAHYEQLLQSLGTVDMQLLGIGLNGHIGFNEPAETFAKETNCVALTESTISANARFFKTISEVPTHAYTMGIGTIMKADKILLMASGAAKAEIIHKSFFGPITPKVPASVLQLHKDVIVVLDKEAASAI